MNIIFIVCDTLRRDYLGCYGSSWVRTPSLDALGASGTIFDRAYVGSFPTMPMRADLMTGKYVFQNVGWAPLQAGYVPMQTHLRGAGYVTAMITDHVQMLAPGMNYHQGFNGVQWIRGQASDPHITDVIDVELPCAREKLRQPDNWVLQYFRNISRRRVERDWFSPQTMQAAMDWLDTNYRHEQFFLYIDTFDVHEPWTPPQWYVDLYDPGYQGEAVIYPRYDRVGYMSEAELQHARCLYAGTITMMDRWIGMLLDKVDLMGLRDNTAVFFISDHGWYHGEHDYVGKHTVLDRNAGWQFYEEVAHLPFMLRAPGLPEGGRSDILLQPVDVMPTVLELAGVEVPEGLHGKSILPALRGEGPAPREIAVTSPRMAESPEPRYYSTVTDGRWTLIYAGENALPELYDTQTDPQQKREVIAEHADIARELHARHVELLEAIDTPEERLKLRRTLEIGVD